MASIVTRTAGGAPIFQGWGGLARILPFLEGGAAYAAINYGFTNETPQNATVIGTVVATYLCPSDPESAVPVMMEGLQRVATNYGLNRGNWYVWGGLVSQMKPPSPFRTNSVVRFSEIRDGLSGTLMAADVLSHWPFLQNCSGLSFAPVSGTPMPLPNASPSSIPQYNGCSGGELRADYGHAGWEDANLPESGFTTAWTPNKKTPGQADGQSFPDVDLASIREEEGGPTFGAVTARSYHPGGVNALFCDGSVRFVKDTIAGQSWRAIGTVAGSEVVSADAY